LWCRRNARSTIFVTGRNIGVVYNAGGRRTERVVTPAQTGLLLAAGFLAGAVNAVAGGGTLLTFPALLASGLSPVAANVTNTVAVWPGYLSGAATYRTELRRERSRLVRLGAVATAGGVVGTIALLTAPEKVFAALVPYLVLGATAALAVQPWLSRRLAARRPAPAGPATSAVPADGAAGGPASASDGAAAGSRTDQSGRAGAGPSGRAGLPIGLLAATFVGAVYGAYFGGGLGIILLAVLALGTGETLARLNGTKTALSLIINTVALLGFAAFGPIDWLSALLVAPASLAGGAVGGRLAQRLHPAVLRAAVVIFGAAVGGYLWWRQNLA
jgi:uncharacterized membrane protein YfcA